MHSSYKITVFLVLFAACSAFGADTIPSGLELGYRDMYNLQFDQAHKRFEDWQRTHPTDPMGPVSNAAAYLFSEFDRLHILESQFFTNNDNFESRSRPAADPAVKQAFMAQIDKAKQLSNKALAQNPNDPNALFASVLTLGLQGDYAALIEKRDFAGLGYLKDGRVMADRLLRVDPNCYDAYIAVGVENYLLSLKPAPVRWILRFGGAQTDKDTGLKNLQIAAEKGHYLRPYARLLLAVAALRDQDRGKARTLLAGLAQEFPLNHLYTRELNQLQ
jgi:tetratricopeptide (TPR) repeat protein